MEYNSVYKERKSKKIQGIAGKKKRESRKRIDAHVRVTVTMAMTETVQGMRGV